MMQKIRPEAGAEPRRRRADEVVGCCREVQVERGAGETESDVVGRGFSEQKLVGVCYSFLDCLLFMIYNANIIFYYLQCKLWRMSSSYIQ